MGLILHCGAKPVEYEQLKEFDITPRKHTWVSTKTGKQHTLERSERWQGLQHYDFASQIITCCEALGMPVDMSESQWGVSDEGSDLFALLKFLNRCPDGKESVLAKYNKNNIIPTMGVRHSNRGRISQQITIGGDVTVCDNMVITGTFMLKKKHTSGNVNNIQSHIVDGLIKYIKELPTLHYTIEQMQSTPMADIEAANFCQKLGREKLVPWSHIGYVDKYWQNPTHDEFSDRNQWRMYNAVNTVVKRYNPHRQFEVVSKLKNVFTNTRHEAEQFQLPVTFE